MPWGWSKSAVMASPVAVPFSFVTTTVCVDWHDTSSWPEAVRAAKRNSGSRKTFIRADRGAVRFNTLCGVFSVWAVAPRECWGRVEQGLELRHLGPKGRSAFLCDEQTYDLEGTLASGCWKCSVHEPPDACVDIWAEEFIGIHSSEVAEKDDGSDQLSDCYVAGDGQLEVRGVYRAGVDVRRCVTKACKCDYVVSASLS